MAILTKAFYGVLAGTLYPQWFQAGEPCPAELEAAARAIGALEDPKKKPPTSSAEKS